MSKILIFGGLMIDRYHFVDRFPQRGQDGRIERTFDCVGGCAVNMAMTVNSLGGLPYVVSYVGKDKMGQACLTYLQQKGLPTDCVRQIGAVQPAETMVRKEGEELAETEGDRTGYCMVFLEPDGERTFLTREGCEGKFDRSLLPEQVLQECTAVAVTGYYLLGEKGKCVAEVLEELKRRGYALLFDPGPMVGYILPQVLNRVIALADLLTPNEEEALFLAQGASREQWASELASTGCTVVLKKGAAGGVVFSRDGAFSYESPFVEVADSTGAGDSFAGALAFSMTKGWSLGKAVETAAHCAALTAAVMGPHGELNDNLSEKK